MSEKRLSIRKLAEICGVSAMTVSLALRNHPRISESTRRHIQKEADRHGYEPSAPLSKVMSQIRHAPRLQAEETIAVLTSEGDFLPPILKGIRKKAAEMGYAVDMFRYDPAYMTERRLNDILISRGIRGLLITPFAKDQQDLDIEWDKFCTVAMGDTLTKPGVVKIVREFFNDMIFLYNYLGNENYKRVGVAFYVDRLVWHARIAEAATLLHNREIKPENRIPPFFIWPWDDKTDTQQHAAFTQWFSQNSPDVVIANTSILYHWLLQNAVSIPEEVGFINTSMSSEFQETMTGFYPDFEQMGRVAIDRLIRMLQDNELGLNEYPRSSLVQSVWVRGKTLR